MRSESQLVPASTFTLHATSRSACGNDTLQYAVFFVQILAEIMSKYSYSGYVSGKRSDRRSVDPAVFFRHPTFDKATAVTSLLAFDVDVTLQFLRHIANY